MIFRDHALSYAAIGWPIFPVGRNKKPLFKDWQTLATCNPEQVKLWIADYPDANIATIPGRNPCPSMVLDFDPGADPTDDFGLSETAGTKLWATTPSGGTHEWYALGEGETVRPSASKIGPHVDVRSSDSYVLIEPSVTDKGTYRWNVDPRGPRRIVPHYRTDAMIAAAGAARLRPAQDAMVWLVEPDLPANILKARHWLLTVARPAIQGEGGDANTYAAACMMRSFGLSEETALLEMDAHYNPRCVPPWDDLSEKVKNAYKYPTSPAGNVVYEKPPIFERHFDLDADDWIRPLASIARVKPEWVVENLIGRGHIGLLSGGPGSLKTQDVIALAICVITGRPWYGAEIKKTGPVILLALEDGSAMHDRRDAVMAGMGLTPEEETAVAQGFMVQELKDSMKLPRDVEKLARGMERWQPVLVIVDTVREAMMGSVSKEEDVNPFLDILGEAARAGPAIVAVGHISAEAGKVPLEDQRPKGLTDFQDRADFVFLKEAKVDKGTGRLYVAKVKNARRGYMINLAIKPNEGGFPMQSATDAPPETPAQQAANEARVKRSTGEAAIFTDIVDSELRTLLEENVGVQWGQNALAKKLADFMVRRRHVVSEALLRKRIPQLRPGHDYYYVDEGTWVCRTPIKKDPKNVRTSPAAPQNVVPFRPVTSPDLPAPRRRTPRAG